MQRFRVIGVLVALLSAGAGLAAAPATTRTAVPLVIEPLGYQHVVLDSGLLRAQLDLARQEYLRISNDDLLKGFRQRAGKPAPGNDLGGWYSDDVFHVFGQILSGLTRMHAVTGDPALRTKAEALLAGWAECVEADGYFKYSRKNFANHYIYDKMDGGHVDMIVLDRSKLAEEKLEAITGWAMKNLERERGPVQNGTEWYTLSENLYRAYEATGDERYRDFAAVWHYSGYWDRYARNEDPFADADKILNAGHAYSHVNTLGGAAQAYRVTGEKHYLETIRNAHDYLLAHQCYATGGYGPDEQLLPRDQWLGRVDTSHNTFETQCGSFAVFKLCKYLLTFTGEARYGDWIEKLAYNGIAATIPMSPQGHVFYYSDYSLTGGAKRLHPKGWTCCTGTRPMAIADLVDLIYFTSENAVLVNLFVPSTLTWKNGVTLKQTTQFPEEEQTELGISTSQPREFAIKLRVPVWLGKKTLECRVNGDSVAAQVDARGWAVIHRSWSDGDRLFVSLPMRLESRPLDAREEFPAAIVRGPVTFAVQASDHHPGELLRDRKVLETVQAAPGAPLTYRAGEFVIRPFYSFKKGERYHMYLDPRRTGLFAHSAARFSEGWKGDAEAAFRFTNAAGSSVTFTFTGTAIKWIGQRFDDAGIAQVEIDGAKVARVDQYAPKRGGHFEWSSPKLPAGEHTLTITATGEKAGKSKQCFINVAAFEVSQ